MSVTASTTRSMRFLPVSDQSLLVELQDLAHTLVYWLRCEPRCRLACENWCPPHVPS